MGTANSNNPNYDQKLDNFFGVFDPTNSTGHYGDLNYLVQNQNVFCPDNPPKNPTIPSVGITDHGPNFTGAAEITTLFQQLFNSFNPPQPLQPGQLALAITQYPNATGRLYSPDNQPTTIGIRAILQGTYVQPWFQKDKKKKDKDSHYSKPLSDIPVFASAQMNLNQIPGFVVFTFGDNAHPYSVSQVSMYLDRYRFITDLTVPSDQLARYWESLERSK